MLDVSWVPRELNAEADAITNCNVGWLNPELEIKTGFSDLPFLVLRDLLALGEEFQKDLEAVNVDDASVTLQQCAGPAALLKVRGPWD